MKKSILANTLILCMTLLLVGCQGGDATPDEATPVETVAIETTPQYVTFTLDAFGYNGIDYLFSVEEEYGTDKREVRINNITFTAQPDAVIEDVLNDNGYSKLKLIELQDDFLGFMEYKKIVTVDENDVETVTYEKVSDTLYSSKELMEKTVPEYSVTYLARWENIDDDYYAAYGF